MGHRLVAGGPERRSLHDAHMATASAEKTKLTRPQHGCAHSCATSKAGRLVWHSRSVLLPYTVRAVAGTPGNQLGHWSLKKIHYLAIGQILLVLSKAAGEKPADLFFFKTGKCVDLTRSPKNGKRNCVVVLAPLE